MMYHLRSISALLGAIAIAATASATKVWAADENAVSHWPVGASFPGTPPRAQPKPGSACEVANRYVTFVSTDQARKVPALFADDGAFLGVGNTVLRGPTEIATFYNLVHQSGAIPLSFIDAGEHCIMELAGKRPSDISGQPDQYKLVAIDHFIIDKNHKIASLVIFFRPLAIPPLK